MRGPYWTDSSRRRSGASGLLCLLIGACLWAAVAGYKPVIIVHGLLDGPGQFRTLLNFIEDAHPGTKVHVINLFNGIDPFNDDSLRPLWKQVEAFKDAVSPIMRSAPDGVHLICYSQGGLICRGIVSTLADHNVHSFVSLASPQAGQYGETEYPADYLTYVPRFITSSLSRFVKSNLYRLCYTQLGQKKVSICNYWKDPHHRDLYVTSSDYLALLDGERPHPDSAAWRENFLRVKKLVLIGGPDDGVVTPWQSSQFGFYDDGERVVEMRRQDVYSRDVFGLRTLEARGDLAACSVSGVKHVRWHHNEMVFRKCIEEWLV